MDRSVEIGYIVGMIQDIWLQHPQLRLGQLLINQGGFLSGADSFYVSDKDVLAALKKAVNSPEVPQ